MTAAPATPTSFPKEYETTIVRMDEPAVDTELLENLAVDDSLVTEPLAPHLDSGNDPIPPPSEQQQPSEQHEQAQEEQDEHDTEQISDNEQADASLEQQPSQEEVERIQKRAMELNEAYKALEKMRRFNLEVACQDCGIAPPPLSANEEEEECSACWLQGLSQKRDASWRGKVYHYTKVKSHKVGDHQALKPLKKLAQHREQARRPNRCLTCATPCCPRHVSAAFRREGLTVCLECEQVFSLDYLLDSVVVNHNNNDDTMESNNNNPTTRQERQARMDRLLELYDRALLLLKFSEPFLPQAIETLENTKHRDNHINFGGSTVGIVSGILGVAAAATIVTPAGVPLLIVSLLLGGAATGAQTGTEVHAKFFSEPKQLANRIMALHGMALSILNLVRVLRDVVTQDHVQLNAWQGDDEPEIYGLAQDANSNIDNSNNPTSPSSSQSTRSPTAQLGASSQLGSLVLPDKASMSRSVRQMSRSMTGTLRSIQPIAVAGGVLAGATIVLEAKNMAVTLASIRDGSPCEKAQALREIQQELAAGRIGAEKEETKSQDEDNDKFEQNPTKQQQEEETEQQSRLVDTATLDQECCAYLAYLEERRLDKKQVLELLDQATKAAEARAAADRTNLSMREKWSSFSQKHFKRGNSSRNESGTLPTLSEVDQGNESDVSAGSSSNLTHAPSTDDDREAPAERAPSTPPPSWRSRLPSRRRAKSDDPDNYVHGEDGQLDSSPTRPSWMNRLPPRPTMPRRRANSNGSLNSNGSSEKKKRSPFSWSSRMNRSRDSLGGDDSSNNIDDSETSSIVETATPPTVSWKARMQQFQSPRRGTDSATRTSTV